MNISVKQSGGFAGESVDIATVNTTSLDAAVAQRLEHMVRDIRFFDLPNTVGDAIGADLFRYEITVTNGNRQHTVVFVADDGSSKTAPLRSLVDAVLSLR